MIGALGGLIGLGEAEFRLPLLIGLFRFAALEAVILNKAMSLAVVATALPFRSGTVPFGQIAAHWPIVVNLLALARYDEGREQVWAAPVEVREVVDAAWKPLAREAAAKGLELRQAISPGLRFETDPEKLALVVQNLLSNAVKFSKPDGTVTLAARREGEEVHLTVTDDGMGIPPGEQQALFARFFRASNAIHQAIPGTGLGLAIVRTIVDNHGGRIAVDSTQGVGTTVTVRLPVR